MGRAAAAAAALVWDCMGAAAEGARLEGVVAQGWGEGQGAGEAAGPGAQGGGMAAGVWCLGWGSEGVSMGGAAWGRAPATRCGCTGDCCWALLVSRLAHLLQQPLAGSEPWG